jgi:hypothetical protein
VSRARLLLRMSFIGRRVVAARLMKNKHQSTDIHSLSDPQKNKQKTKVNILIGWNWILMVLIY